MKKEKDRVVVSEPRSATVELETDDSEATDLLEMMEREERDDPEEPDAPDQQPVATDRYAGEEGSLALESVYFRSFGNRPLLTREEEIAIAKRIDQGTRAIRTTLRDAIGTAGQMRKDEQILETIISLKEIRILSGFSATALNRADAALASLQQAARGTSKAARRRVKQFSAYRRQIHDARTILETAKDEMVRCNLRLVVDVAKHYIGRGLSLMDLVQEGNMGLMKAAERYQYRKGFKFSTYATWWIRQGITRSLADQSRTIRIPVHLTEASHRIVRTARRLVQQLGREPKLAEIGQALRVRPERVQETMQAFKEPVSLENPVGDGETLLGELIADRQAVPPDAHVHRTELTRELDRILEVLTPREQLVIRMRFGIGQDEPFTLEQVGQNLSVTRERIRQIEAKALKKLKTREMMDKFTSIR
jgi:RNA polymerase primary sigma factor